MHQHVSRSLLQRVAAMAMLSTLGVAPVGAVTVNAALNADTLASSTYDPPTHSSDKAVDNDIAGTWWSSTGHGRPGAPQWLKISLGDIYEISSFVLYGQQGVPPSWPDYTNTYELYAGVWSGTDSLGFAASDLGPMIASGTLIDNVEPALHSATHTFTTPVVANSILYLVTGGSHWAHLYELQAWGSVRTSRDGEIPLPATLALSGLGLLGLAFLRRRNNA